MNTITLTVQSITRTESQVLKKFGLRTFAELDRTGKPVAYFGEVHQSTLNDVPRKPIITRIKRRTAVTKNTLLTSVSKKARMPIAKNTQLDQVARYCHRRLRTGRLSRADLTNGLQADLGLAANQAGPAISDLLNPTRYNHLKVASDG